MSYPDRACPNHQNCQIKTVPEDSKGICEQGDKFFYCWDTNCTGFIEDSDEDCYCSVCNEHYQECENCHDYHELYENKKGGECVSCELMLCVGCHQHGFSIDFELLDEIDDPDEFLEFLGDKMRLIDNEGKFCDECGKKAKEIKEEWLKK